MSPQLSSGTGLAFTPAARRALLDEYFATSRSLAEVEELLGRATGLDALRLSQHLGMYVARLTTLTEAYGAGLPVVPICRCPFTDQILYHSLDYMGLDGLWWNYEGAVRPRRDLHLATFFALTGALRLTGAPPLFPFLCRPGPEAPYVVPRILKHQALRAVISAIDIGGHQGYAITYFARPQPADLPRVNTWGANMYWLIGPNGEAGWNTEREALEDFDFDLLPWITQGRLYWIAPGDQSLTLRNTPAGCAYLGLPGRRSLTRIQSGKVWWPEDVLKATGTKEIP
ncbi:MAG: hypothetical protein FJ135_02675 [Deltaproteobacteria bacterium]|nr:hypothetical protein [Deltaproteobacteria bacterium]